MKKIRINFTGFWPDWENTSNFLLDILRKHFEVELSPRPDFLFVSVFGEPYKFLDYDCVRILYTAEPFIPDFNVFDYAIGFDNIIIPDQFDNNRYYRYPEYMQDYSRLKLCANGMTHAEAASALKIKKHFCNYIYSHKSGGGMRESIFRVIQSYKRVESVGSFLNNQPDGTVIPRSEAKLDFLKLCKFTIACESTSYPGFMTEKVTDCFLTNSIPIYYGNPLCENELNSGAFVNLHSFSSLEEALKRIIEIDMNDELYLKMLTEPKFISDDYLDRLQTGLEDFLLQIFSQEKEKAYRRPLYFNRQADWLKACQKYIKISYPIKELSYRGKACLGSAIPKPIKRIIKSFS